MSSFYFLDLTDGQLSDNEQPPQPLLQVDPFFLSRMILAMAPASATAINTVMMILAKFSIINVNMVLPPAHRFVIRTSKVYHG
jgi:hypothetical protein